jgi:hypothetical protein
MFLLHTGTMNELVKTKIDLEKTTAKTVEDLIVKLNGTLLLKPLLKNLKQKTKRESIWLIN